MATLFSDGNISPGRMAARPPEFGKQTDEILKRVRLQCRRGCQPTPAENRTAHPDRQSCGHASINRCCDIANQCSPRMHLSLAPHLRKKRHGDQQQFKRSGRDLALCRRMAPSQYNWQRCVRSGSRTWLMIPSRQHSLVAFKIVRLLAQSSDVFMPSVSI